MKIARRKDALRELTTSWRRSGETIGVVPTMGALHAGHLSLVEAARARADRVIVTLFVNPRQFNNPEDLAKYPRTEDSDAEKLAPLGVDVLYAPEPEDIYQEGFATTVSLTGVSEGLCGATRPGHFDGVATVVTKLLLQTGADWGFFGEKDYQQLQIVTRLAADLDLKSEICGCPTLREADGLAMSSRNLRLNARNREIAPMIYQVLHSTTNVIAAGGDITLALETASTALTVAGFDQIEYLELRGDPDLQLMRHLDRPARLFVAAWLGGVRLIDNMAIDARLNNLTIATPSME